MNELKEVINQSTFFWFWGNTLYYGYQPNYNSPVCTPLSIRNSDLDGDQIRFAALYKNADVYWHSVNSWIYGTPYSPGESATYYIDISGNSSPRTGNILETRGVTPQYKGKQHSSSWWHRMAAIHSSGDEWWIWLSSASYVTVRS